MHLLDVKGRIAAVLLALVTAIPSWTGSHAVAMPTAKVEAPETKAPKRKKRITKQRTPWTLKPLAAAIIDTGPEPAPEPEPEPSPLEVILDVAHAQLGKPYRYGAVGPATFDCSGFTMFVFRHAGIHLPHNSGAQRAATPSVGLDELQPGDLIFSPGHVGLYIGDGQMIHAPQTGRNVEIAPIHSRAYGAGRLL